MAGKNEDIVTWIVIHGNQIGRTLGFPTANLAIEPNTCTLDNVASVCEVVFDGKKYPAMGSYLPFKKMYEVHLLDRQGDLYDKEITIHILETIRENRKFESQEELRQQLQHDREYSKNWWALRTILDKKKTEAQEEEEEETDEIIGI